MPTLRRKLRIFVEWTWGMCFPIDITHLRFSGSQALLEADLAAHAKAARAVTPQVLR
jgi:NADH:ubiquinone reductase (H+-translocating)